MKSSARPFFALLVIVLMTFSSDVHAATATTLPEYPPESKATAEPEAKRPKNSGYKVALAVDDEALQDLSRKKARAICGRRVC